MRGGVGLFDVGFGIHFSDFDGEFGLVSGERVLEVGFEEGAEGFGEGLAGLEGPSGEDGDGEVDEIGRGFGAGGVVFDEVGVGFDALAVDGGLGGESLGEGL